jgi:acetyl esterase
MVIDTATGTFLEGMRAAGGKPLHQQTVAEVRATVGMASLQLGCAAVELHRIANHRIPVPGGDFGVRVYTPRQPRAGEALPLLVYYHGGGFVAGDVDTHDTLVRYLSKHADAIAINVDYRRPPESKFPGPVDDSYAALEWAVAQASALGGDPARIAVAGDSAGGNLAAVVSQLARDRRGPRIAYQVLIYPLVDQDLKADYPSRRQFGGGDYFLSLADMQWFGSNYLGDRGQNLKDPRLSPIAAPNLAGLPPALVVTAGFDPLRDEGQAYADRLKAAGVPVEYRCYENTIHAFVSFASAIPAGAEALAFMASQVRKALHG